MYSRGGVWVWYLFLFLIMRKVETAHDHSSLDTIPGNLYLWKRNLFCCIMILYIFFFERVLWDVLCCTLYFFSLLYSQYLCINFTKKSWILFFRWKKSWILGAKGHSPCFLAFQPQGFRLAGVLSFVVAFLFPPPVCMTRGGNKYWSQFHYISFIVALYAKNPIVIVVYVTSCRDLFFFCSKLFG